MKRTVRQGFAVRLAEAMTEAGYVRRMGSLIGPDVYALMKVAGVTRQAAWRYLEGLSLPDSERLPAIAEWCGVNVAWLHFGVGPKHGATGTPDPDDVVRDEAEKQLLRYFRHASPSQRDFILSAAKVAVLKNGETE